MVKSIQNEENWDNVILPKKGLFAINFKEIWEYRDLLIMFVKRDFVTLYKQTILGPIWFFLQPIFTTIIYVFVFGNVAKLSTDGSPKILFYMSGIILWNYFAECFNKTATVFKNNQNIFGKVYFPRLITPLSIITSSLLKLAIQFLLFIAILAYYAFFLSYQFDFNIQLLLLPLLILLMAAISLGFGLIITSLTTKYRDLVFLLQFGVQLLMYATPVIYPLSSLPDKYRWFIELNPMTSIIETFRYGILGSGSFSWNNLIYTTVFAFVIVSLGTLVFNKTERKFMDTV